MSFMNIFKKKQTDEEFLKELGLDDPPKADPAAAALGPAQGSSAFPGVAAMGAQITMSSPSLSSSQIAQALAGLTVGLSKEEQTSLDQLRKEHQASVKHAKLGTFKKLPAEIRQQVVNAYEWKTCFDNMNATTVVKDPKLEALEKKEELHSMFSHSGYKRQSSSIAIDPTAYPGIFFGINMGLPQGVTLEDLKQAHMEASLEEEMLGNGQS